MRKPPIAPPAGTTAVARFTLLFAVAGIPLLLIPDIFLGHDVIPKVVVILVSAALLLFNTGSWSGGLRPMWNCGSGRALLILALAQALSLGLSTVFSPSAGVALAGTVWRRFGAAEQLAALLVSIAAAAMSSQDQKWRTHLFRAMSAAGTVAACYVPSCRVAGQCCPGN